MMFQPMLIISGVISSAENKKRKHGFLDLQVHLRRGFGQPLILSRELITKFDLHELRPQNNSFSSGIIIHQRRRLEHRN